jgi:hypothetical protein
MTDDEAMEATEEIEQLVLKLDRVCLDAKSEHDLEWRQIFFALCWAMRDMMRTCPCPDCRKIALRHVKKDLPGVLREEMAYAVEKYAGHVGHC